jgi:hypothetical protein
MRRLHIGLLLALIIVAIAPIGEAQVFGTAAKRFLSRASAPVACNEGEVYYNTTDNTQYNCTAADTWTAVGGGGGANTMTTDTAQSVTALKTFTAANDAAAIAMTRATTGVGTIATNGTTAVTGTNTQFLSQVRAGDTITPNGQSARTVEYVTSDTSLTLATAASGTGSGLTYTLSALATSLYSNATFSRPIGTRTGKAGSVAIGDVQEGSSSSTANNVLIGDGLNLRNSGANTGNVIIGWTPTLMNAGSSGTITNSVFVGATSGTGGGNATGVNNATAIGHGSSVGTSSHGGVAIGKDAAIPAGQTNNIVLSSMAGTITFTTASRQMTVVGPYDSYWGSGPTMQIYGPSEFTFNGSGGTGADQIGGSLGFFGGKGTGAGVPGSLRFGTPYPGASSSTLQTIADRDFIRSAPKTLTESSATSVIDIAVATGTVTGGTLFYTIEANDGTEYQARRGQVTFSAVNKSGTPTAAIGTATETVAVSTGTLTCTPTVTTAAGKITLQLNAVSSLTQTVLRATWRVALDGGTGAVSPL